MLMMAMRRLKCSDMTYIAGGTTVMSGTQANLESVLTTTLPGLVDSNDHFLFYAFDHGSGAMNAPAITGEEVHRLGIR